MAYKTGATFWVPYVKQYARKWGVPENWFVNQIKLESNFNPYAVSSAGAIGIAQIIPKYHPGVNPRDPYASLDYAAKWLASLYKQFGAWDKAFAAYYAGPGTVSNAVRNCGSKNWRNCVNSTTRWYVDKCMTGAGGGTSLAPSITDIVNDLPKHKTRRYGTRSLSRITTIVVHYTAGPCQNGTLSMQGAANYHVHTHGWPGVAYHVMVSCDGRIYLTNYLKTVSWHAGPANSYGVGLCYAGDNRPNAAQLAAMRSAVAWIQDQVGRTLRIIGHKEVMATACPGPYWPSWKSSIIPGPGVYVPVILKGDDSPTSDLPQTSTLPDLTGFTDLLTWLQSKLNQIHDFLTVWFDRARTLAVVLYSALYALAVSHFRPLEDMAVRLYDKLVTLALTWYSTLRYYVDPWLTMAYLLFDFWRERVLSWLTELYANGLYWLKTKWPFAYSLLTWWIDWGLSFLTWARDKLEWLFLQRWARLVWVLVTAWDSLTWLVTDGLPTLVLGVSVLRSWVKTVGLTGIQNLLAFVATGLREVNTFLADPRGYIWGHLEDSLLELVDDWITERW